MKNKQTILISESEVNSFCNQSLLRLFYINKKIDSFLLGLKAGVN